MTTQEKVMQVLAKYRAQEPGFEDVEIVEIKTTNKSEGGGQITFYGKTEEEDTTLIVSGRTYGEGVVGSYGPSIWHYYTGNFSVPEGQYLTRFFFVAGDTASGNPTIGNFIDDVHVSETIPAPNDGQANVVVAKVVTGIVEDLPLNYAVPISVELQASNDDTSETYTSEEQKSDFDRFNANLRAQWFFPLTISANQHYSVLKFEELENAYTAGKTYQVEGYDLTSTQWEIKITPRDGTPSTVTGAGKNASTTLLNNIKIKEGDKVEFTFTNNYEPIVGSVSFTKIDASNDNPVSGALFGLYMDPACNNRARFMNVDAAGENAGKSAVATSGDDGTVTFAYMHTGTFYMKEERAPIGYVRDNTIYKVEIATDQANSKIYSPGTDAAGNIVWTEINEKKIANNPYFKVRFVKVEAGNNNKKLSDAVFSASFVEGRNLTSNENGVLTDTVTTTPLVTVTDHELASGTYTLTEITAPSFYNMLTSEIRVVVAYGVENPVTAFCGGPELSVEKVQNGAEDVYVVYIPNSPGVELPSTGYNHPATLTAAGMTMVAVVGAVLYHRKKEDE